MKTFFLIVALCASVAVATPNAILNKLIADCLKKTGWTVGDYRSQCGKTSPEENAETLNYFGLLACIYEKAGIMYKMFGKYIIDPAKAEKLVPNEVAQKVTEVFKRCKDSALEGDMSDPKKIALRLIRCLYKENGWVAAQTCRNTMDKVVVQ